MNHLVRGILSAVVVSVALPSSALRIGTFDGSRGGELSFGFSAQTSTIREAIHNGIAGVTYAPGATLTPAFLSGIDVLMISSVAIGSTAISPLSAAEQTALRAFVEAGGSALLFADNDSFNGGNSDPANESLVDAFGFDVTGTASPGMNVTVVAPTNPISNGPFGNVTSTTFWYTGNFNTLGPGAVNVANVDSLGGSGVAYVPRGTLSASSGAVVVFSDSTFVYNGFTSLSGNTLVLNSLAYAAVPEPATLVALGLGLGAVVRRRQKR